MADIVATAPVILLDGLLGSGSSLISRYVGQSYSFTVINGNQYLRDLGTTTGFVTALPGTFEHEAQLLDFYLYIVKDGAAVHDQIYSFLSSKIGIAKDPTVVRCTGYAAYALSRNIPVKRTYWLRATINDRVSRLFDLHKLQHDDNNTNYVKSKLEQLDYEWEQKLKTHLGIDMRAAESNEDFVINTDNMTVDQAFQKLANIESFIDAYNSLSSMMPDYTHDWRRWHCLNCHLVSETNKTIVQCPRCGNNDPNKFQDAD